MSKLVGETSGRRYDALCLFNARQCDVDAWQAAQAAFRGDRSVYETLAKKNGAALPWDVARSFFFDKAHEMP